MFSVVVSGADGRTGRRLVPLLRASGEVSSVTTVDASAPASELKRAMEGATVLVHLGLATAVGGVLEAASSGSISTLLYRSSASVYGAWADNRVPLTEDVLLARGMMGDGQIDLRALRSAVDSAGYTGDIEVEIFNQALWDADPILVLDTLVKRYQGCVL